MTRSTSFNWFRFVAGDINDNLLEISLSVSFPYDDDDDDDGDDDDMRFER